MDHLNKLPNEMLKKVLKVTFRKVSLSERLQYRLVSTRWCVAIEDICHDMKSLKLFGMQYANYELYANYLSEHDPSDIDYWKLKDVGNDDDLKVNRNYFKKPMCDLLARLFPNIQNLVACFNGKVAWVNLPHLLNKCDSLTSISFVGLVNLMDFSQDPSNRGIHNVVEIRDPKEIILGILRSINQMPSLKRLDFLLENFEHEDLSLANEIANILPQLERFSLSHFLNGVYGTVHVYGEVIGLLGPSCTHLRLSCDNFDDGPFCISFAANPNLPLNLKHLYLTGYKDKHVNDAIRMFDDLTSLQSLTLHVGGAFLGNSFFLNNQTLKRMHKLVNLAELRLVADCEQSIYYDAASLSIPKLGDTPLRSVKRFSWIQFDCFPLTFKADLLCKTLSAWFPTLEELYIDTTFIEMEMEFNLDLFPCLIKHQFEDIPEDDWRHMGRHKKQLSFDNDDYVADD